MLAREFYGLLLVTIRALESKILPTYLQGIIGEISVDVPVVRREEKTLNSDHFGSRQARRIGAPCSWCPGCIGSYRSKYSD